MKRKFAKNVLVVTDNLELSSVFKECAAQFTTRQVKFTYVYSPGNEHFQGVFANRPDFACLDLRRDCTTALEYDLAFSIHCKQAFPAELVRSIRCINLHPGLNPYNRGWYPQVFSIINKLPLGATLHEMDDELDHGPIIDQEIVPVFDWDTSFTAYERVLKSEVRLLQKNFARLLDGNYDTRKPASEGNINRRSDFTALCKIDLSKGGSFGEFYDLLRALSHGEYRNAYFTDPTGAKIFIRLETYREELEN